MRIPMAPTAHDRLGGRRAKTGDRLADFAAPHDRFPDAGAGVTLAWPTGGQPPVDPKSEGRPLGAVCPGPAADLMPGLRQGTEAA